MSFEYNETNLVEQAASDIFKDLGWEIKEAYKKEIFGKEGTFGRENKSDVILIKYLFPVLKKLNPNLPEIAYKKTYQIIKEFTVNSKLVKINKDKYKLFKDGINIDFKDSDGENITKKYLEMAINSMANIPERTFREILKCLITFDRYGDIEKISSPCCLLAGNNDMNAPSKTMKKMSEKIKNSEFYSFDNVGHLINIEIPEETNKVIFKFYESLNT